MKLHFKTFKKLFFLLVVLSLTNCEKEIELENYNNTSPQERIKIETVSKSFIEQNLKVVEALNKFKEKNTILTQNERTVYSETHGFIINTESAIYIENNYFHSFTFEMYSEESNVNLLENFVLTSQDDGTYQAYIYQYNVETINDFNDNFITINSYTKIILPNNLEFISNLLNREENNNPCRIDYWSGPGSNGYYTSKEECQEVANGTCTIHHSVINENCNENETENINEDDSGGTTYGIVDVYVYNGTTGNYELWDPNNNTTTGTNTNGGGTNYNPPTNATVPHISAGQYLVNTLQLNSFTDTELISWILDRDNFEAVNVLSAFLDENEMSIYTIKDVKLTIITLSSEVPWVESAGYFNGITSLAYTHIRTIYVNGTPITQFKLINGDIISKGDYGIWQDTNIRIYYYSQAMKKWFEMPEPSAYNPLNLDFIFEQFWSNVVIGVRYFTPLEDAIILIDGKDFDGVESSRAVAGVFILIDIVPGSKALKITRKAGTTLTAASPIVRVVVDQIYKNQKAIVKQYTGIIELASNLRKGNFGEIATDVDLYERGYKKLHINQIDDIDFGGHNGIDHIFKNEQTGEYIIVESKYHGTGGLNPANPNTDLPRQMSDDWISNGERDINDRLYQALGQDDNLYNQIEGNYIRVLARINPDGSVYYTLINNEGYLILGNAGIFVP